MLFLTTSEPTHMTPLGFIILAAFAVALIVGFTYDKNKKHVNAKDLENRFAGQILHKFNIGSFNGFFTIDYLVITQAMRDWYIIPLKSIDCVGYIPGQRPLDPCYIKFQAPNGKSVKDENGLSTKYISGTKKKDVYELMNLLSKYAPYVKLYWAGKPFEEASKEL